MQRREQRPVGDERVARQVGGVPTSGTSDPFRELAQQREPVDEGARLLLVTADDERAIHARVVQLRDQGTDRRSRSLTMRAERCGTTMKPAKRSRAASATVASRPFVGDAVTETVAPCDGKCAAWSIALLSGISSNVGDRSSAASASRDDGVSRAWRRKSTGSDL